jgi:RNA-binding protein
MPAPTNPKKKSLMPSGELRRRLRAHGHTLTPIVQIGKGGITSGVVQQVTGALFDHELIKVKLGGETPESRFEAAERLGDEPGVQIVQILGRNLLLYKRHPQKPRYEGEPARARREGTAEPKKAGRRKKRKTTTKRARR